MATQGISIYRQEFNPNTRKYEDLNPIPPYRNGFRYRCLCNHSDKVFTRCSDFTQHFKNKTHRTYVEEYERNTKDVMDANERIFELQTKIVSMSNQELRLQRIIDEQNEKITKMERLIYQRLMLEELD